MSGNVSQGNRDNSMSFIPLTFIPLTSHIKIIYKSPGSLAASRKEF